MKRQGFTLIELLVVIAIIAILAAILFPVFMMAKAAGKKSACVSNTRQIASAWTMYADTYNGAIPPLTDMSYTVSWVQTLMPYVKNNKVYWCPAGERLPDDLAASMRIGRQTYGWNATLFNYPWLFPVKQSDLERPARTVFLADTEGYNWISLPGPASLSVCYNDPYYNINGKNGTHISGRHNGQVVVAFCDGHVGSLSITELTKTEPGQGRKVAVLDRYNDGDWTTTATKIFPYFMVSASGRHF